MVWNRGGEEAFLAGMVNAALGSTLPMLLRRTCISFVMIHENECYILISKENYLGLRRLLREAFSAECIGSSSKNKRLSRASGPNCAALF